MKKFLATILFACLTVGIVYAQTKTPPAATAKSAGASVSASVKQLEHDWTDAMKAKDTDKLDQILADDWVSLAVDGARVNKKEFIAMVKAGDYVLTSFDFGPMDVKVVGSIAIVQGSDTEKSTTKGKDSSGKYGWMDVFANRNGKWQAVRSQNAMLK